MNANDRTNDKTNDRSNGSNFYMLTAQILNDKNLSHAEKLTMAILNGLSDENGRCYPSNKWLEEKLDLKENAVRKVLENLEKNSYIFRQIIVCANNPFKRYRIIYINNNSKLSLPILENEGSEPLENDYPDPSKTAGIIDKKEVIDKKEEDLLSAVRTSPPTPTTQSLKGSKESLERSKKLLEKIKLIHPKLKSPDLDKWAIEMDKIHRVDKRSWEEIDAMIEWIFEDDFWVKQIQSPAALRRHWDKMAIRQAKVTNKGTTEKKNREIANNIKDCLTQAGCQKQIWIGNTFVRNTETGDSINFDLNSNQFEAILCKWFGISKGG